MPRLSKKKFVWAWQVWLKQAGKALKKVLSTPSTSLTKLAVPAISAAGQNHPPAFHDPQSSFLSFFWLTKSLTFLSVWLNPHLTKVCKLQKIPTRGKR